jgi:hypothetical protein
MHALHLSVMQGHLRRDKVNRLQNSLVEHQSLYNIHGTAVHAIDVVSEV